MLQLLHWTLPLHSIDRSLPVLCCMMPADFHHRRLSHMLCSSWSSCSLPNRCPSRRVALILLHLLWTRSHSSLCHSGISPLWWHLPCLALLAPWDSSSALWLRTEHLVCLGICTSVSLSLFWMSWLLSHLASGLHQLGSPLRRLVLTQALHVAVQGCWLLARYALDLAEWRLFHLLHKSSPVWGVWRCLLACGFHLSSLHPFAMPLRTLWLCPQGHIRRCHPCASPSECHLDVWRTMVLQCTCHIHSSWAFLQTTRPSGCLQSFFHTIPSWASTPLWCLLLSPLSSSTIPSAVACSSPHRSELAKMHLSHLLWRRHSRVALPCGRWFCW